MMQRERTIGKEKGDRYNLPARPGGCFAQIVPVPFFLLLAAALAVSLTVGCGGPGGPARYDVEGQVTYGDQPVPAGRVVFEPDPAKGNKGPASYAEINDGSYATESGKGTVGGPHVVRILGTDGVANEESPGGNMLFSPFQTTADLPKEAATQDFEVPESHK